MEKKIDTEDNLDLGIFLGKLEERMNNWDTHFSNHLSKHKWDRFYNALYFALVVVMFCYLKWGV